MKLASQTLRVTLIIYILFMLAGCTKYQTTYKIIDYVNQDIKGIIDLEIRAKKHYYAVVGKNYTSNQAVLEAIKNDVMPIYKRFMLLLRKIKPKHTEIQQVHFIYLRAAESTYDGFRLKMIGLKKDDVRLMQLGNDKIKSGWEETENWRAELFKLYKKYGVHQKSE